MKKIVVLGGYGQLGCELCRQIGQAALPLGRQDLDITDRDQVRGILESHGPSAVINAAAYTQVDRAESERSLCMRVNGDAVEHLATVCGDIGCTLVQISTDYVFGRDEQRMTPYREVDATGPLSTYANSKLRGEQAAAQYEKHFIVRTCGLYGPDSRPTQRNFVETVLRIARERGVLRVVDDQQCTPSYVVDVARAVIFLLQTGHYGTFHVVNAGATTWFDFAAEALRQAEIPAQLERISTAEYNAPAPRPAYSVLDTAKYHALGGPTMRRWQEALAAYLDAPRE